MAKGSKGAAKSSNLFQNLISSLFGGSDPEAIKRKALKNIAKELSKTKYHFYKAGSHEVDPSFAKFFYELYKAISPAQVLLQNTTPNNMKKLVINSSMSENQHELLESLSEESISEAARKGSLKEVTQQVKQNLQTFTSGFDSAKITSIDALYTKMVLFSNFCQYDFYFLLRKFDNTLKERNFNGLPKFQAINGSYISEELKNFISVAWALPFDASWDDLFQLLKERNGSVEPIPLNVWKKIITRLRGLRDRRVFEMMIQLITENPNYSEIIKAEEQHIIDDYISQIKKQVEETLVTLKKKQTAGKVENLLTQIFGSTHIDSLRNYNESMSSVFARKNFEGYLYCEPLSYLKQFLLEYTKKEMRELSDILLVRGEWATQQLAAPMSEAYNQLLGISEKITTLDNKLAENGEFGVKLKTLLPRSDRDKEARNIINMVLGDANYEAGKMLLTASKNFITYGQNLKMGLEDFVKVPHSKLIVNWKDLDHFAEGKLKQMCIDAYKKIYLFVSLLQNFKVELKEEEE